MPKILLFALNSSYSHTNLAVRCIRKSLTDAGFSCDIAEFNLKDKRRRVLSALVSANADIYGFSAYIWNMRELCNFAADLKKLRPDAKIVFGGPEVSFDCDEILAEHPYIDCIVAGEGEDAFCALAQMYDEGRTIPRIMDGGIYSGFTKQGILYTPGEMHEASRVVYYESSRGCPFRCAYCLSAMSGKVRAKNAQTTLAELLEFENIENIKIIKFVDRTFNFDRERAKTIWRGLLSEKYTKNYHFEICAELLDEESFDILSRFPSGKVQLEIGVQSTNPETLRRVDRSPETDGIIKNITRLYKIGNMHIHADLIAGLPGEDIVSFARSFDALYGRCDMLQLGFLKLLRGSKLRYDADDFGCIYSDEPPYEVLSTDCVNFDELCLLHDIADLCERYCGGAFRRSMALIMSRAESPFGIFEALAEKLSLDGLHITEISQPRAYELLYQYMHAGDDRKLSELLTLDFLTSQKLSSPAIGGYELKRGSNHLKRDFMKYADMHGIVYFAPALEVREGAGNYVIDRRNMRAFSEDNGSFVEI